MKAKSLKIKNIKPKKYAPLIFVLVLLAFVYFLGRKDGLVAGSTMFTNKPINSPTPTLEPTNTPTPSISVSQSAPTTNQNQPSERALKAAGTIYAYYTTEEQRALIREKNGGIPKSDENTEIMQLAFWFDKNPGTLAKIEGLIDNYRAKSKDTIILPR